MANIHPKSTSKKFSTVDLPSVLVVDDDAAVRELIAFLMEDEGYAVLTASNGLEGLDIFRKAPPDLVILDWMMPVLDGKQFLHRMRDVPGFQRSAILVVSSVDPGEIGDLKLSGFLSKPFEISELQAAVQAILVDRGHYTDRQNDEYQPCLPGLVT